MAFKKYIFKGVIHCDSFNDDTKTLYYSMDVINAHSGALMWKASGLKFTTTSVGRQLFIGLNKAARDVVFKDLNLPQTTPIRIEVANTVEGLKMVPKKPVVVIAEPEKIQPVSDTEKKYAVVCKNGIWTIEKFDVPQLVTKEEALEILLEKTCK